ncbi:MAG: NUDIX domain-containing protein, partial [Chloroflexaceae bacterium]|nr:NUDIX domain-containing protein [Chloroflexaceae bacterium]
MGVFNIANTPKSTKKVGTSILFINESHQVLLCLRDDKPGIPFPNCWDVPGGGVEGEETPLACITREMHEEIGLELHEPML